MKFFTVLVLALSIFILSPQAKSDKSLNYTLPSPGTDLQYKCSQFKSDNTLESSFSGTMKFENAGRDKIKVTLRDSEKITGFQVKSKWQIPSDITDVRQFGKVSRREVITPDSNRQNGPWKLKEKRLIYTYLLGIAEDVPSGLDAKNAIRVSHDVQILSKVEIELETPVGKKKVKTIHSIDRVFQYRDNVSYTVETYYSPEIRWPARVKRSLEKGAYLQCDHYKI